MFVPHRKLDVIVSNGWHRVGYNIIRSLGRKSLKVGLADSERFGMSAFSRYTSVFLRHPSYSLYPHAFIEQLKTSMIRYSPSVYIPSDDEVFVVAEHRESFRGLGTRIPIADANTLKVLHLKNESSRIAQSLGIPVPETIQPSDEGDILSFSKEVGSPIVLKLIRSSGSEGVFFLEGEYLAIRVREIIQKHKLAYGDFIVQQHVRGVGYGVSLLYNNGQLRAKFTHKRLREKLTTGGTSTLRMSTKNPCLEEYASRLLEHISFHGVAMVEFKFDEVTGRGWFIEVNPRFWGSLALAIHAGIDFPYLLYRMALDGDIAPVLSYREGVCVKWILGDVVTALGRSGRVFRFSANQEYSNIDGYDDLYWDDPLPFGGEFLCYFLKLLRKRSHRVSIKPVRV